MSCPKISSYQFVLEISAQLWQMAPIIKSLAPIDPHSDLMQYVAGKAGKSIMNTHDFIRIKQSSLAYYPSVLLSVYHR